MNESAFHSCIVKTIEHPKKRGLITLIIKIVGSRSCRLLYYHEKRLGRPKGAVNQYRNAIIYTRERRKKGIATSGRCYVVTRHSFQLSRERAVASGSNSPPGRSWSGLSRNLIDNYFRWYWTDDHYKFSCQTWHNILTRCREIHSVWCGFSQRGFEVTPSSFLQTNESMITN